MPEITVNMATGRTEEQKAGMMRDITQALVKNLGVDAEAVVIQINEAPLTHKITVGTEVDIRHLAATPVGATVRTTAKVIVVERRVIRFEVEAFDEERKIGEGRHARGLVNLEIFNKRFAAR